MTSGKKYLLEDHAQLERRLQRLCEAIENEGSRTDLRRIWSGFEANLLDQLGTEERCLFPIVAQEHRAEVEALHAEHQLIRCVLTELGIRVEQHTLGKAAVVDLIDFLRRHAAREDAGLYKWLEEQGSPPPVRGLLAVFERHGVRRPSEPPPEQR